MKLGWVAPLLLLVVSSLIGVLMLETVGRRIVGPDRISFYDDIDHRLKPHSEPDINGDGIRSKLESSEFRPDGHNIIFLGDSFTYGWKLESDQSFPAQFGEIARERHPQLDLLVANFGWPSSSPLLSDRLLRQIGHRYSPDVVILAVDMTDFHDDLKYGALLERSRLNAWMDWTPVTVLTVRKLMTYVPLLFRLHEIMFDFPVHRFFVTEQTLDESRPWLGAIRENIESVARYSREELDAKFVLMLLPRNYQYDSKESPHSWERHEHEPMGPYAREPFRYFEEIASELDFPVYSLLPDFEQADVFPTCFDNDPHWNLQGTRVAAEAAYEYCLQAGCFEAN